jgi:hypothetical protein
MGGQEGMASEQTEGGACRKTIPWVLLTSAFLFGCESMNAGNVMTVEGFISAMAFTALSLFIAREGFKDVGGQKYLAAIVMGMAVGWMAAAYEPWIGKALAITEVLSGLVYATDHSR